VPTYSVFYQVLTRMKPEDFAPLIGDWLRQQTGKLPAALALDGKMIRERIGILTLAQHEDGAPFAAGIVSKGGEYILQVKGNQPSLLSQAEAFDAIANTPFF